MTTTMMMVMLELETRQSFPSLRRHRGEVQRESLSVLDASQLKNFNQFVPVLSSPILCQPDIGCCCRGCGPVARANRSTSLVRRRVLRSSAAFRCSLGNESPKICCSIRSRHTLECATFVLVSPCANARQRGYLVE